MTGVSGSGKSSIEMCIRDSIGVVFQDFRLLKDRNVYENIAFAQQVVGAPNRLIKKNVIDVYKRQPQGGGVIWV